MTMEGFHQICVVPKSRSIASNLKTHVRVKNRRKRYLDMHPEYFSSPYLELADPLAYDRLIRRFQSPSEREAEGRNKGYSGVLEADLWRSEAKIDTLAHPDPAATTTYRRSTSGEILAEERDELPSDKDDGMQRWQKQMELRFLKGDDTDFDYTLVDVTEDYDDRDLEEREKEEEWFDDEEPAWTTADDHHGGHNTKVLKGQTGVQDY